MSEIAGFKYETWEKSSNIAHRDFQHTTMAEDFEKAPRRKWGKNHNKPSPNNKKGCEANDGGKHIYEKVRINRKSFGLLTVSGKLTLMFERCVSVVERKAERVSGTTMVRCTPKLTKGT